jgi:predicted ribosome quality control (RQC) complex YloA/Tae2 family protein
MRVQSAHQEGEHRLRLALEGAGRRADLVLDLDPDLPRCHLAAHVAPGKAPTALAQALRNALSGARVEGARAVPGERALALTLSLGGLARTLWFEGFGRQANLYVLDEGGRVLLTPRGDVATARGAGVGAAFRPVPPRTPEGGAAPESWEGASERVAALAASALAAESLAARRTALERARRRALSKAEGALAALAEMRALAERAPELRRKGELLRASFHLLARGLARVRVPDHGADPVVLVELELEPERAPSEQVAECFREAQRFERGALEAARRAPALEERVALLRALEATVREAADEDALAGLEREAGLAAPAREGRSRGATPAAPWRTFTSADGWRILVGKDARGNDRLTRDEARPEDLWLHVRAAPGSHVVVPTPRGKTVPKETLLDAAELACLYSARAKAEHNEVDYVERRHVTKRKGAPPGEVTLARAKTLRVRRDDERRRRLLESSSQAKSG